MTTSHVRISLTAALLFCLAGTAMAQHHHHHGDFIIGRDAGDKLVLDFDTDDHLHLEPITSPPLAGWSAAEPGFDDLGADEPGEGIFTLNTAVADIVVNFTSVPDAFKIWDGLSLVGSSYDLPTPDPHKHLTWHVDSNDPNFNPAVLDYPLSFYFSDTSGTYSDSDVYTVTFEIPEPATMAMLGISGIALLRRRR